MVYIINKGSRKRLVHLQKDLINVVNRNMGNNEKCQQAVRDFCEMSHETGIFKRNGDECLKKVATFEPPKDNRR